MPDKLFSPVTKHVKLVTTYLGIPKLSNQRKVRGLESTPKGVTPTVRHIMLLSNVLKRENRGLD